jgi:HlyD family secretion protein
VKPRFWIALAALVVLGLLSLAVVPRLLGRRNVADAAPPAAVVAARPRSGAAERTLRYSGTLRAKGTITVMSKVPGRLESLLVSEGQVVARDEPLARIEDKAVRLQLRQARAALQAAEAQYAKARQGVRAEELENARALHEKARKDLATAEESFQRSERLFRSGAIAKAQYEEAEGRLRSARTELENAGRTLQMLEEGAGPQEQEMAQSQVEAARASYELARLRLEDTEIRAPERGSVARILQDEGNTVGGAVPILVLVQDDPILAEVAVPERHYGELLEERDSIRCRVRPSAYPDAGAFAGKITAVAPTVNPGSRTFTVSVEIPNPEMLLRPGMYAEVELVLERRESALLVPETAVLERGGRTVVFVLEEEGTADGQARRETVAREREVLTGLSGPGAIEILRGVSPADRLVVEGNAFLEDGQAVLVAEEP